MGLVLHGITAYEYWRSGLFRGTPEFGILSNALKLTDICHFSAKAVSRSLAELPGKQGDLHVLVGAGSQRKPLDGLRRHCHLFGDGLPRDSFYQIGHDLYAPSPELCLLQLACVLPTLELARAATDLCSRYLLSPYDRMTTVECEPVTSRDRLLAYLSECEGLQGANMARKVASWAVEGTRSPRETTLALLATLPTRIGGFQIPGYVANKKVALKGDAHLMTRKTYLEADAAIEDTMELLEYESDEDHGKHEQATVDFEKIVALQAMGYHVTPITTWHLSRFDTTEAILNGLRRRIGASVNTSKAVSARRMQAHYELLETERRQRHEPCIADTRRWQYLLPRL